VKLLAADAEALGSFGNTQAEIVKTLLDEKARILKCKITFYKHLLNGPSFYRKRERCYKNNLTRKPKEEAGTGIKPLLGLLMV
jgi:hypothetical protein